MSIEINREELQERSSRIRQGGRRLTIKRMRSEENDLFATV